MSKTNHVYVLNKEHAWVPAIVKSNDGATVQVSVPQYANEQSITCDGGATSKKSATQTIHLKDYANQVLPLQNVSDQGRLQEMDDMINMPFLNEVKAIIRRLRKRDDGRLTAISLLFCMSARHSLQPQSSSYSREALHSRW